MKSGNHRVVQLLLTFGADLNSLNRELLTPLDVAVECSNEPVICLLQSLGAVQGEVAKKLSFSAPIPRLKSFYDTAKMKLLLAQKRAKMRKLNANRLQNSYHSTSSESAEINGHQQYNGIHGSKDEGTCTNGIISADVTTSGESSMDRTEMVDGTALGSNAKTHVRFRAEEDIASEGLHSSHSLSLATLGDMENGDTFLPLHERLQQCININLELSGT